MTRVCSSSPHAVAAKDSTITNAPRVSTPNAGRRHPSHDPTSCKRLFIFRLLGRVAGYQPGEEFRFHASRLRLEHERVARVRAFVRSRKLQTVELAQHAAFHERVYKSARGNRSARDGTTGADAEAHGDTALGARVLREHELVTCAEGPEARHHHELDLRGREALSRLR